MPEPRPLREIQPPEPLDPHRLSALLTRTLASLQETSNRMQMIALTLRLAEREHPQDTVLRRNILDDMAEARDILNGLTDIARRISQSSLIQFLSQDQLEYL
jgi:division protein CdvB (Snf7/Vps24/ESCRT-III family)